MPLSDVAQNEPSVNDWLGSRYDGAWAGSDADPNQWGGDAVYGAGERKRWQDLKNYQFTSPELQQGEKDMLARAQKQALESRQHEQQMYGLAQNWANGGATPQQLQMQKGFDAQRVGVNAVANAATGGARGAMAARQGAGMQNLNDAQFNDLSMMQQKARDQQMGQQMMMHAATQMRQHDIEGMNAATQYAAQNENNRLAWQSMNDQNDMFYSNMLDNRELAMRGVQLENAEQQFQMGLQEDARKQARMNAGLAGAAAAFDYGSKAWGSGGNSNSGQGPSGRNPEVPWDDEGLGENSYGV